MKEIPGAGEVGTLSEGMHPFLVVYPLNQVQSYG